METIVGILQDHGLILIGLIGFLLVSAHWYIVLAALWRGGRLDRALAIACVSAILVLQVVVLVGLFTSARVKIDMFTLGMAALAPWAMAWFLLLPVLVVVRIAQAIVWLADFGDRSAQGNGK